MAVSRQNTFSNSAYFASPDQWRLTPIAGATALIVLGQFSANAWAQSAADKTLAPVSVTGSRNESQGYKPDIASTGSKLRYP